MKSKTKIKVRLLKSLGFQIVPNGCYKKLDNGGYGGKTFRPELEFDLRVMQSQINWQSTLVYRRGCYFEFTNLYKGKYKRINYFHDIDEESYKSAEQAFLLIYKLNYGNPILPV